MKLKFRMRYVALFGVGYFLACVVAIHAEWISLVNGTGLAMFVSGFMLAVMAFWNEIKLGVQVKREARKKVKETVVSQ